MGFQASCIEISHLYRAERKKCFTHVSNKGRREGKGGGGGGDDFEFKLLINDVLRGLISSFFLSKPYSDFPTLSNSLFKSSFFVR